jgi:hypothetical protein
MTSGDRKPIPAAPIRKKIVEEKDICGAILRWPMAKSMSR